MAGNSFGKLFQVTTFGESHGVAMGVVIDGVPPGLTLDLEAVRRDLQRRRPGQSDIVSPRQEQDDFEILSGLLDGTTTGAPLTFIVRNKDARSGDYASMQNLYRPSHADFTYEAKYGLHDRRGGGRASARETVARVIAGAVAKQVLAPLQLEINAFVSQVGSIGMAKPYSDYNLPAAEMNAVRCPDPEMALAMIAAIEAARRVGDTLGGVITAVVKGMPAGLGEPVFDKLEADLAKAMMSLPATKGFEIGSGFQGVTMKGSEHNDKPIGIDNTADGTRIQTASNNSGGVQGGISNGADLLFRVAFKPVSTVMQAQQTLDRDGKVVEYTPEGRHDPCVLPRAVPIVEAMTAIVLADHWLRLKTLR